MDDHRVPQDQEEIIDLPAIMQAFGVSEWNVLGSVEALPPETLQVKVEIEGERYILRERPEEMIEEDPAHRYAFRAFLQREGIPIPPLWLGPQGEPAVAVGDTHFELEREPAGERFSTSDPRSLAWVRSAGAMLARIHQASRRFAGPVHRWPAEAHIGAVVQGYLNLARSKAETGQIAAVSAALTHWCEQWEAVLPQAMVAIGSVRGLPEFHIHGDYHTLNLRFDSHDVTAVLNWDASRWEKRIIELAYGSFYFSALQWHQDSTQTRPLVKRGLDPERLGHFLEGYGSIYAPVPHEASILGDALILVSPIATMNGPLEDIFYTETGPEESLIDDVMERLAWATSLPAWLSRVRRSLGEMWA